MIFASTFSQLVGVWGWLDAMPCMLSWACLWPYWCLEGARELMLLKCTLACIWLVQTSEGCLESMPQVLWKGLYVALNRCLKHVRTQCPICFLGPVAGPYRRPKGVEMDALSAYKSLDKAIAAGWRELELLSQVFANVCTSFSRVIWMDAAHDC